jgi:hypothetical protein
MASIYGPDTTEAVRRLVSALVADRLAEKEFSTGSTGFFVRGELQIDGRKFFVQAQAVEAGSRR